MIFNVESAAPSLQAIEEEQQRLDLEIIAFAKIRRLTNTIYVVAGLAIAAILIIGNAVFQWVPWSDVLFSAVAAFAFTVALFGVFKSAVTGIAVAVAGIAVVAGGFGAAAYFAFGFITITGFHVLCLAYQRNNLKKQSDALQPVDKEACLEIKQWLNDPTIDNYRVQVLQAGREFMRGEVDAMRAFWNSRSSRMKDGKKAAAIEAACKEVYFGKPLAEG